MAPKPKPPSLNMSPLRVAPSDDPDDPNRRPEMLTYEQKFTRLRRSFLSAHKQLGLRFPPPRPKFRPITGTIAQRPAFSYDAQLHANHLRKRRAQKVWYYKHRGKRVAIMLWITERERLQIRMASYDMEVSMASLLRLAIRRFLRSRRTYPTSGEVEQGMLRRRAAAHILKNREELELLGSFPSGQAPTPYDEPLPDRYPEGMVPAFAKKARKPPARPTDQYLLDPDTPQEERDTWLIRKHDDPRRPRDDRQQPPWTVSEVVDAEPAPSPPPPHKKAFLFQKRKPLALTPGEEAPQPLPKKRLMVRVRQPDR